MANCALPPKGTRSPSSLPHSAALGVNCAPWSLLHRISAPSLVPTHTCLLEGLPDGPGKETPTTAIARSHDVPPLPLSMTWQARQFAFNYEIDS